MPRSAFAVGGTMHVSERFYRVILDAIPSPVFLVDEDIRIYELNRAATKLFGLVSRTVLMQRGGEALHCLNARDSPEGCGHGPHCGECVIRNSVLTCLAGQAVHRRRMKFQTVKAGSTKDIELMITVAPLPTEEGKLTLMTLEDITENTLLKSIIPICMHCKKVRDDQLYWQQVEGYFHRYIGVDFSHGVCPECLQQHYSETRR